MFEIYSFKNITNQLLLFLMPTKFKQMKICKILISASALIILLSGCKEGLNKSSAVGVYNFENTNRIEGNEITTKRYLVISEGEKGEYKYSIINTIIVNKKEIEELEKVERKIIPKTSNK